MDYFLQSQTFVSSKETNLGWDVFMRRSEKYKEKEGQKGGGTMVVGLAVNCGMLPRLFKEHYLYTCDNLSTVIRQADMYNKFNAIFKCRKRARQRKFQQRLCIPHNENSS